MGICKVNKKVQLLIQTTKYNSGNTNNNQLASNLFVTDNVSHFSQISSSRQVLVLVDHRLDLKSQLFHHAPTTCVFSLASMFLTRLIHTN